MGQELPGFDLHVPLLSLPLLHETTIENVPNTTPYLHPDAEHHSQWQGLFPEDNKFKVGVCWAGKGYPDPRRSCPAESLTALAHLDEISWYSLQVGWKEALPFPMIDFTDRIRDFSDTASMISRMDLVLTIDTSVAHLAGALGKPAWVMLPHTPDWRWLLERDDSPWYPSMRLFRHRGPNGWFDVIRHILHDLKNRQTAARN